MTNCDQIYGNVDIRFGENIGQTKWQHPQLITHPTYTMATGRVVSSLVSLIVILAAFWYSKDDGHAMLQRRLREVLDAMLEVKIRVAGVV